MSSANSGKELEAAVLSQFAVQGVSLDQGIVRAAFASFIKNMDRGLDDTAAANVNLCCDYSTGVGVRVTECKFVSSAALTSDNTNYVNMQLVYNNGNGGADTIVAQANSTNTGATLGTGNWVAGVPVALTVNASNAVIPSGSQVQFKFLKVASGVNVPAGSVVLKGRWE